MVGKSNLNVMVVMESMLFGLALVILLRIGPTPTDAFRLVQSFPLHRPSANQFKSRSCNTISFVATSNSIIHHQQSQRRSSAGSVILYVGSVASPTVSVLSSTLQTIAAFSKSNTATILDTITQNAIATPPVAYFLALLSAGCGIPVSEDALCVFCGAIVWPATPNRVQLFLALYAGVVVSDYVTFWIGRALRLGLFAPLANRLKLQQQQEEEEEDIGNDDYNGKNGRNERMSDSLPKYDTIDTKQLTTTQRRLQQAGDWAGFVIRFSVGTRGPLMLLAGFSNQIPFTKFALGASLGAAITLPLQLYAGYALGGRNPKAVVGLVAGMSSFVLAAAVVMTTVTTSTLALSKLAIFPRRHQQHLIGDDTRKG